MAAGCSPDRILRETRSTNTGENVLFTRSLLEKQGIHARKLVVVHKPYMERRSFATFRRLWPEVEIRVTSPQIGLNDYLSRYASRELSPDEVIAIIVGDLHRIRVYPERGYQIPQEIPTEVWIAFETLVRAGYDRHLVSTAPQNAPPIPT